MATDLSTATKRKKLKVRREPYWATISPGRFLGYRRTETGGIWRVWNRASGGGQDRLGREQDMDHAEAWTAALKWFERAAGPEAGEVRVKDCLSAYLDHLHNNNPSATYSTYRSRIDKHIRPQLGETRVSELTGDRIDKWLRKLGGPAGESDEHRKRRYSANKCRQILMTALMNHAPKDVRFARGDEWKSAKPLKGGVSGSRVGFFDEGESHRLVNSCDGAFRDFVTFCLQTGCRPREAANMRVRDFDARTATWRVRVSKTGERVTYVTAATVALLTSVTAGKAPGDLVFVRDDGAAWDKNNMRVPFRAAVARAKLDPEASPYWTRHTHISLQLLNGARPYMVAKNTGTSLRMLEQTYAQFMGKDMVEMLEAGEIQYERPKSKVVNIR